MLIGKHRSSEVNILGGLLNTVAEAARGREVMEIRNTKGIFAAVAFLHFFRSTAAALSPHPRPEPPVPALAHLLSLPSHLSASRGSPALNRQDCVIFFLNAAVFVLRRVRRV